MALFIVYCIDKPGALDVRMANRPTHLEWAGAYSDQIAVGGPLFADDGETFAGSMFLIDFPSINEARAWADSDPYAKAGLFERVEIRPYRWLVGDGKTA
ncbi:MAG: YciI family protein [Pseudomonadota bacterium]